MSGWKVGGERREWNADFSIIDYTGGIEDLERRSIRTIGDPELRFREDPVRMMRACELAGRLGLTIDAESQRAIVECRREIDKASPARLTEEILQLLRSRQASGALQWMLELGLLEILLPESLEMTAAGDGEPTCLQGIPPAVDRLVSDGRQPSDIALFGALLFPRVWARRRQAERAAGHRLGKRRFATLAAETVAPFFSRFQLSKVRGEQLVEALLGLEDLRRGDWEGADRLRFARKPFFENAFFLLELLGEVDGLEPGVVETWREVARRMPRFNLYKGSSSLISPNLLFASCENELAVCLWQNSLEMPQLIEIMIL